METLQPIMDENLYNGLDVPYRWLYRQYKKRIKETNEMRNVDEQIVLRSFQTVWRIIKEKRDLYKQQKARDGRVAAKLQREGTKPVWEKPQRPLERVELDWTLVDIKLVDPKTLKAKNPWLIYAIDVFSGHPLGFYITFDYPDSFAVKQCLMHCILPKTYLKTLYPDIPREWAAFGIPNELVMDNAAINDSYELESVFNTLGIDPLYPEVSAGHKKGTVERGLKTFNDIMHTLKGTTFSNIFERKQYDSDGEACITLQAFYYIAHYVFVGIVAHNVSHSRFGSTPHDIWKRGYVDNPQLDYELPFSKRDIRIMLCGGSQKRKVQSRGVTIARGWYQSSELMRLRARFQQEGKEETEVVVRFDYADVKKVYVENPYDYSYIDAELDPNTIKGYEKHFGIEPNLPLPFQQIKAISLQIGRTIREFDDTPIAEAIDKIKEIQNAQKLDKRHNYAKTIAQEASIIEELAQSNVVLENRKPLEAPESFSYIGEVPESELKKSKRRKKENKGMEPVKEENNENDYVIVDTIPYAEMEDDLPDYEVSFLGGD